MKWFFYSKNVYHINHYIYIYFILPILFYTFFSVGILKASSYLDFEIETRYRFKVVVMDLVGHTCTSDIFIKVIDINDNSPTFLQPLYKATLRENATYGVVVTQVF